MIRIEIVANHSVEDNIMEALRQEGVGKFYTKYPSVFGVGAKGPRMGDAIWPEENFAMVIWCEEDEARGIERALEGVKQRFPDEGIKLFRPPEVVMPPPPLPPAYSPEAPYYRTASPPVLPAPPPPPPVYYGPEEENS
ncbi:MAG: hypothetical protein LBD74_05755 [Spirochaetaceae bacterium]|jgi:hypothetical protein|nr:hypothetical protein [Spirochaetaceae bacterium]